MALLYGCAGRLKQWVSVRAGAPPAPGAAAPGLDCAGPPGRFSAIGAFHTDRFLYGAFIWMRRALNRPKRLRPGRVGMALRAKKIKELLELAAELAVRRPLRATFTRNYRPTGITYQTCTDMSMISVLIQPTL